MSEESCPFCAAERWPVVIALSHFGTWHHLGATTSSSTDVYPSTATFSFRNATFDSPTIAVRTTELANNAGRPLQAATALDTALINRYDVPPYVNSADQSGAVPFLDIDNPEVLAGAQYNPQVLAGLSMSQIAAQLENPASPVAIAVDGSADALIAAIDQALHPARPVARSEVITQGCRPGSRLGRTPRRMGATTLGLTRRVAACRRWVGCVGLPDDCSLREQCRFGVPGHRCDQLRKGDNESAVGDRRGARGSPRAGVLRGHGIDECASCVAERTSPGSLGSNRAGGVGVAFAVYLVYTELFTIHAICLWCTSAHVMAFLLFAVILFGESLGPPSSRGLMVPGPGERVPRRNAVGPGRPRPCNPPAITRWAPCSLTVLLHRPSASDPPGAGGRRPTLSRLFRSRPGPVTVSQGEAPSTSGNTAERGPM